MRTVLPAHMSEDELKAIVPEFDPLMLDPKGQAPAKASGPRDPATYRGNRRKVVRDMLAPFYEAHPAKDAGHESRQRARRLASTHALSRPLVRAGQA